MPALINTRTKRARWEALLVRRWMPVPMSPQGGNTMAENNTPGKKTFAERAAAEPTELHKAFAKWIEEKTGVTPDLKTVQLVTTMRMDFQRSDENQKALTERKAEAAKKAEEAKARKLAKLEAELAKLKGEEAATDEAKPKEPAEAPKDDAEPAAEADTENGAEAATEAAAEPTEDAPKPRTRRTRRTTTK